MSHELFSRITQKNQELCDFRRQLLLNGYQPIPVAGKNGLNTGWTSGEITHQRVIDETQNSPTMTNTGLRCGETVCVDNDVIDPQHAAAVNEIVEFILGPTPLKRYGSKGAALIYRNETPVGKLTMTAADGTRLFEVLGTGQQFVGFGRHPAGMDYRWENKDPANFLLADLPEVTPDQLRELIATIRELLTELGYSLKQEAPKQPTPPKPEASTYDNDNHGGDDQSPDEIRQLCAAALAVTPNEATREEWIDMCYAIHDAGLDYGDWRDWCGKWSGTNTDKEILKAWNSCANPRAVTFKTLLKAAADADPNWRSRYYQPINEARREAYYQSERERIAREIFEMDGEPQPEIDDDDQDQDDPAKERKPTPRWRTYFDEYEALPPIEYWDDHGFLMKKQEGTTMLATGYWGHHKTNIISWLTLGAVLDRGAVALYVACEGAYGLGRERIPAFCKARGITTRDLRGRFEFRPQGIILTDPKSVDDLIANNQDFKPDIIIIDTLNQATPGIDSNSKLMGDLLGTNGPIGKIRKAFGCLVIILCHPPKSGGEANFDSDISGHGSIIGNTDVILGMFYKKREHLVTATIQRNKDGPENLKLWFKIPETGIPVPELTDDPEKQKETCGMQKRNYQQDEASQIRQILRFHKNHAELTREFFGLTNRQMAEQLYKLTHNSVPDNEDKETWIDNKITKLEKVQQHLHKDYNEPYRNLCCFVLKGQRKVWSWIVQEDFQNGLPAATSL